ncbi:MAG TPA: hypothetical protein PKM78_06160 [Anaerolineae bacterium]|nr:hypothetical protein [Anaerolineae bacterium]HNU05689.1 hypothetical protein [Anaerolineae bacterium]
MIYKTGAAFRQALEDRLLAQSSREPASTARNLDGDVQKAGRRSRPKRRDPFRRWPDSARIFGACAARRGERSLVASRATMAVNPWVVFDSYDAMQQTMVSGQSVGFVQGESTKHQGGPGGNA